MYLPTLDGWRAIAISLVLAAHGIPALYELLGWQAGAASETIQLTGLFGVRIFFCLSGFLITSRLLAEEEHRGQIDLVDFYIRRFFRIVPAAFVMLAVAGLLSFLGIFQITLGRWFSQLLFWANYSSAETNYFVGHFWSLSIEEHFYFVWPGILVLTPPNRRIAVALLGALVIAIWRGVDWKFHLTGATPAEFWARSDIQGDFLLWGAIVALLSRDTRGKALLVWFTDLRIGRYIIAAALLGGPFISMAGWKLHLALLSALGIAISLAIFKTVQRPESSPSRLLECASVRWFGRLSYSTYLWQQLFLCPPALIVSQIQVLQTFPLNLLAVLLSASASHYLIERPFIRIGRQVARRRRASSARSRLAPISTTDRDSALMADHLSSKGANIDTPLRHRSS